MQAGIPEARRRPALGRRADFGREAGGEGQNDQSFATGAQIPHDKAVSLVVTMPRPEFRRRIPAWWARTRRSRRVRTTAGVSVEFRSVVDSFKQAPAWGETRERPQDGQDPSRERREAARSAGERGGEFPPEIAFLVGQGVGPGPLLQAMRAAERCAVSADAALLGEGLLPEEALFSRPRAAPARALFFRRMAIADDIDPASVIASGIAPLAANGLGLRAVVAPRGDSIRLLLDAAAAGHPLGGFAVSSPQRLSALVRAKTGARVAEAAACGLERRDSSLSAHSGLSGGQVACVAALAIAAATLALAAPGALRPAVSIPLWLIFAAWIVIRNLAVAASFAAPAVAPLADQDLPVYSVVAALYREAGMINKLIRALDAIDYPVLGSKHTYLEIASRLDILSQACIFVPCKQGAICMSEKSPQSKGGKARAENTTPARRSEIAQASALARWAKASAIPTVEFGSVERPLRLGEVEFDCFVLNNSQRVISQRGLFKGLNVSRGGPRDDMKPDDSGAELPRFATQDWLSPHLSNDLLMALRNPILFSAPGIPRIYGYPATILSDICDAILAARAAGHTTTRQDPIVQRAETLVRAFAKVGIIALVDEATGYQQFRARDELQRILAAYISPELLPWAKRFPGFILRKIASIRGWPYKPGGNARTAYIGKLTKALIYDPLPPGVIQELERRNPYDPTTKRRKHLHHQFLTKEVGHPHLDKRISQ